MKKFILTLIASFAILSVSAQNFSKGEQTITATVGLGDGFKAPIALSYEKAVFGFNTNNLIGVGGYLGFAGSDDNGSNIFIAGEANYHYVGAGKFDIYAGMRLGFRSNDSDPGLAYSLHAGTNYFITDVIGINAELGYGITNLALGVTFKF